MKKQIIQDYKYDCGCKEMEDGCDVNLWKLRQLLNSFLQDIDTEARIDNKIANAIVDVYLKKISHHITQARQEDREEHKK